MQKRKHSASSSSFLFVLRVRDQKQKHFAYIGAGAIPHFFMQTIAHIKNLLYLCSAIH